MTGACMALLAVGFIGVQSAAAAGPGWVNWPADTACSVRDAYLSSSGTNVTVAERMRCNHPVTAKLSLKDSTLGYVVKDSGGYVAWDNIGGTYYAKVYWERTYSGCWPGHLYQVVVSYAVGVDTVSLWYTDYITTGSPKRLC